MKNTQVIIIGGGLAGLTSAIHLAVHKIEVILIEKEKFPHHKVCGEYLSKEVLPYLNLLGVDLFNLKPVTIDELEYTTASGEQIKSPLKMGGLGISRYNLDNFLYEKIISSNCKFISASVSDVNFENDRFRVITSTGEEIISNFVLGAYGKRSSLDKILKRKFINNKSGWLAVKGHYKNDQYPANLVSLHNFEGGYCGLSRTENGAVNVCYLATYKSFKQYKSTLDYKENVLMRNPHLKNFFNNSESLFEQDISIAQVNFDKKSLIKDHVLMIGDAAGLIHPLCGNGMAMAIHSAKIASEQIIEFFGNTNAGRQYVEETYENLWNRQFKRRMKTGRILQKILLNQSLSELSQHFISNFPGIMPQIIKRTHGNTFV